MLWFALGVAYIIAAAWLIWTAIREGDNDCFIMDCEKCWNKEAEVAQ